MTSCWKENPRERPTFHTVLVALSTIYTAARIRHNAQMSDGIAHDGTAGVGGSPLHGVASSSSLSLAETSPDEPLLSEYAGLRQAPDLVVDATNDSTSWLSATYQNNDHLTKKANQNSRHIRHIASNPPSASSSPQVRHNATQNSTIGPTHAVHTTENTKLNGSNNKHYNATSQVGSDSRALPHLSNLMIDTAPPSIVSSPAQPTPRIFLPPSSAGITTPHSSSANKLTAGLNPNAGQVAAGPVTEQAPHIAQTPPVVSVLKSSLSRGSMSRNASNSNVSNRSSPQVSPDRSQAQAQAQAQNIYRNDAALTFELGELTGPTYYIHEDLSDTEDKEADPLDFLFARERKNNGSAPPPEKYLGDKALKPHSVRRASGSKLAGKFK